MKKSSFIVSIIFSAAMLVVTSVQAGNGMPAQKIAVAGGSTLVVGPEDDLTPVTLFSEEFRTANTDLLIQTNAVCAMLLVDFSDINQDLPPEIDLTLLFGAVRVWVELDGIPVLVDANDADGKVAFCGRFLASFEITEEDEGDFNLFLDAMFTANSFTWVAFNVNPGIHTIEVKAEFIEFDIEDPLLEFVKGFIGKRTLIITPTHLAQDDDLGIVP